MVAGTSMDWGALRWYERTVAIVVGAILLALLIVAARLEPNPTGLGTHQQLGLPACTARQWWGVRCPSCGMTTSWSHLMRGNVAAAVRANCGGALLAVLALIGGPWLVVSGVWGRWFFGAPQETASLALGFATLIVTLIDWSIRLYLGI